MRAAAIAVAMLVGASLFSAAPCVATESSQQRGALPRGGSYVLDPDPTIGAAAIALWFRAPGPGFDNAAPGISRLAATSAAVAPLASGKSLLELVHSVGGELSINVYPDIVGVGAVVPATATRRVVAAITAAYFAPAIDDDAVKTAQRDAAVLAVQQRYSTDQTLHDLLFKQIFASGPAHFSPLPDSVAQISRIAPADVTAFAKRAFRSGNAILTLAGNVDASSIGAVTDGSGNAPMDAPYDSVLSGAAGASTIAGAVQGVGLAWAGPPIADEKAATALDFIADYLFRDETGLVPKALDAVAGDTYVTGQFITLHNPGVMLVSIGGSEEGKAKQRVLDALAKLEEPLDEATFNAAREAFLYHIASDTQTPQEQADNLGWYAAEGSAGYAPGDATGEYERTARMLDPAFVADVVRRYLKNPVTVNLVTAVPTKESAS
jgi:predicted Zn-dependent peptidase